MTAVSHNCTINIHPIRYITSRFLIDAQLFLNFFEIFFDAWYWFEHTEILLMGNGGDMIVRCC